MSDSYLLKSYAQTEREKVRKAAEAAEAEVGYNELTAPIAEPQPAKPATPQFEPPKRDPGVVASVKRGLFAIPDRFLEGGQQVADAIIARDQNRTGANDGGLSYFLKSRPVQGTLGLLNMVFPFSAFAGETGGDFGRWAAKATGMLTDEKLRERLIEAESSAPSAPVDSMAGELVGIVNQPNVEAAMLRNLLAMPEAQRLEHFRDFTGSVGEVLSGTIPGYTAPATPSRR